MGVFLTYATPAGSVRLDHRNNLSEIRINDPKRREVTPIPNDVVLRTKPQLVGDMVESANANGLPHDWIIADESYGRN